MATNETAKPCPSTESKKSKVLILKEVLGWVANLYRVFNLVDVSWNWLREHWKVILEWFDNVL